VQNGIRPDRDVTAFGSFTVTTRQAGEIRLLQPVTVTPGVGRQSGLAEAAAAGGRAMDTAARVGAGE